VPLTADKPGNNACSANMFSGDNQTWWFVLQPFIWNLVQVFTIYMESCLSFYYLYGILFKFLLFHELT